MNEIVNQLAQSLFKKNSLQECSRWELEILADHYPYFGIAQFLVTGKLKDENAETYDRQLEKTSLYFTNPLWLDYVINNKISPSGDDSGATEFTEVADVSFIPVKEKEIADENDIISEELAPQDMVTVREPAGESQVEDQLTATEPADESQVEDQVPVTAENIIPGTAPMMPQEELSSETEQEFAGEETDDIGPAEPPGEELKMRPFSFGSLQEPDLKTPLSFEPYHTVDYFASQGIKMVANEKPKDRFEQQLKSFTQWLKTIRSVPVSEIAKDTGPDSEQKVVKLAEHSIEDREIVTEAMAEVWKKQGNPDKAIEIYHKLSLQNPAKSSYFAGLIEQLKQP